MNIVVTGSSGFIGRRLVQRLEQDGHRVVALDIATGVDLTKWKHVQQTTSVDYVFHLAACTFVPAAFEDPQFFYYTNLTSTLNALELCRQNNARFVYASSYVYGEPKYLPIDEKHPTIAHNPYMQSKLMGEDLCQAYWRDYSISSYILRPFNVYGPGQSDEFLIPEIIRQARGGNICLKDSRPKRDFVYIDDIVEAYIACLNFTKSGIEIFNIGSGKQSISVADVVQTIIKLLSCDNVSYLDEHRPNEILDTEADITKAVKMLNWTPKISFTEGILHCIQGD